MALKTAEKLSEIHHAFVDTETTGLMQNHEIWEIAAILDPDTDTPDPGEYVWHIQPEHLETADNIALQINGYFERFAGYRDHSEDIDPWARQNDYPAEKQGAYMTADTFGEYFPKFIRGRVIWCSNPSFDIPRMEKLLRAKRGVPTWHYTPLCIKSAIWGYLARDPDSMPVSTKHTTSEFCKLLGLDPGNYDRHTALGDARMMYDAYQIISGQKEAP